MGDLNKFIIQMRSHPGTIMMVEIENMMMQYDGECTITYSTSGNYEDDIITRNIILPPCIYRENLDEDKSYYENMKEILRRYVIVTKQKGWKIKNNFCNDIDQRGTCV